MGQDLELDFDKYCVVDRSPNTVLLSPLHSKVKKRNARKTSKCVNEVLLSQSKEFTEISLCRYRCASCRDVLSTKLLKRGSVYQNSSEVGKMNKNDEDRKKIAFSRSVASFPFDIFDSMCGSDEDDGTLGSISSSFLETTLNSIKEQENHPPQSTPLSKSLSSRLELPHSPTKSETNSSKRTSPKTRFSPFRKMCESDSYGKLRSQKSLLGSSNREHDRKTSVRPNTIQKSLMNDFLDADFDSCSSTVSTSSLPAHLNGVLKLENKNMMPYIEFLMKNQNDVLLAKSSKVGNGCDWVYTFHTARNRRKVNASGRIFKDLTAVGEMRVSCYLCTELVNAGAFNNSMVTEFVLYDLTRSNASTVKEKSSPEGIELSSLTNVHPNLVADLHPDFQTAAIVIQFPSEKRENLKSDSLLNLSRMKLEINEPAKVSVVIPSGNHGSPSDETRGPSPLLDRWRLGGGCDCGGWDMGCPLIVLGNTTIQKDEACMLPVKLFLKGAKGNTPALTMKMTEDGVYAVDFHVQLTELQAFSICVAVLHSSEASISVTHDNDREMLQCDSLRVCVEDEVKHMIEAVVEEDNRKPDKNEIPPSFLINPPFSPMSRA